MVLGLPGIWSAQTGVGYSFGTSETGGSAYGYVGVTAAMVTASASYSTSGGFSVGVSAGATMFSGLPVSTNFGSVGVNYNISNNSLSGNVSAWQIDQNGTRFNPSFSMMVFPEQTTNLVRGQGFNKNNTVLNNFADAGKHQEAIDYFGFEGEYVGGEGQSHFWFNSEGEYGIRYTEGAFDSYNALYSAHMKESFHQSRYLTLGSEGLGRANTAEGFKQYSLMPEEREGTIYLYKKQGLFRGDRYNYLNGIRNTEDIMNMCNKYGYYSPSYSFTSYQVPWYNVLYRIPRLW